MKPALIVFIAAGFANAAIAQETNEGPCAAEPNNEIQTTSSPDPAENADGYGQIVGERGETNSGAQSDDDGDDAYTGDPAYGDCDGR